MSNIVNMFEFFCLSQSYFFYGMHAWVEKLSKLQKEFVGHCIWKMRSDL